MWCNHGINLLLLLLTLAHTYIMKLGWETQCTKHKLDKKMSDSYVMSCKIIIVACTSLAAFSA